MAPRVKRGIVFASAAGRSGRDEPQSITPTRKSIRAIRWTAPSPTAVARRSEPPHAAHGTINAYWVMVNNTMQAANLMNEGLPATATTLHRGVGRLPTAYDHFYDLDPAQRHVWKKKAHTATPSGTQFWHRPRTQAPGDARSDLMAVDGASSASRWAVFNAADLLARSRISRQDAV